MSRYSDYTYDLREAFKEMAKEKEITSSQMNEIHAGLNDLELDLQKRRYKSAVDSCIYILETLAGLEHED